MDTILEGLRLTLPDGILVERWVSESELIASRERVITLEKELAGIIEGFTGPEAKAFELQCELEVRDAWIRKLVAVTTAASMLVERVPVPIFVRNYVAGGPDPYLGRDNTPLNEPVRYRLQIRRVGDSVAPLEPLWDALVELDEFGKAAK